MESVIRLILPYLIIGALLKGSYGQSIYFRLSATNLPEKDNDGGVDPFAVITGFDGKVYDRTQTITGSHNPKWPKTFNIMYSPHDFVLHHVKIEIRDHDRINPDDHIGYATVYLTDIAEIGVKSYPLTSGDGTTGVLHVSTYKVVNTSVTDPVMNLHFQPY